MHVYSVYNVIQFEPAYSSHKPFDDNSKSFWFGKRIHLILMQEYDSNIKASWIKKNPNVTS